MKKSLFVVLVDGRPFATVSRECTVAAVYDEVRQEFGPKRVVVLQQDTEDITSRFASSYEEEQSFDGQ